MIRNILLVVFIFIGFSLTQAKTIRIGHITDLHYMAPELLVVKGSAFDNYVMKDRKLLQESPAILEAAVQNLLKEKVDIVLISGDLTKDGELESHQGVVRTLQPLLDQGVKVLVVPGNHDINNPFAVRFLGDSTSAVQTVTAEDFSRIYGKFGFDSAISRDANSLSYVSEPVEGLRVLCLDGVKYYYNSFKSKGASVDTRVTRGILKPETMEWIRVEIAKAKAENKQLIGMIHHGVVEHFDYESVYAAPYLLDNYVELQRMLMKAGVRVVFTGHFHASDIARVDDRLGNHLYDVETGSIVTYPCPYRVMQLSGSNLSIQTKHIEQINANFNDSLDFQTYAHHRLEKVVPEILSSYLSHYYESVSTTIPEFAPSFIKVPSEKVLAKMVLKYLTVSGTKLLFANYRGNEQMEVNAVRNRKEFIKDVDRLIADFAIKSSGVLAPVTNEVFKRTDMFRKLKDASKSIWDNKVEKSYRGRDYKFQIHEPINDLNLSIDLGTLK
jgi:3',5'-cyclic AMP phosphodiesterase CpdA